MPAVADVVAVLRLLDQQLHFLVPRYLGKEGIDVQVAEVAGKGLLLVRRQVLAAEEDHQVIDQGAADFRDDRGIEGPRQVDAADLGAQGAADRADGDVLEGGG